MIFHRKPRLLCSKKTINKKFMQSLQLMIILYTRFDTSKILDIRLSFYSILNVVSFAFDLDSCYLVDRVFVL